MAKRKVSAEGVSPAEGNQKSARSASLDQTESGATSLDVDALRQIVEILEASDVTRLSWRRGRERLLIRRGQPTTTIVHASPASAGVTPVPMQMEPVRAPVVAVPAQGGSAAGAAEKSGHLVTSPFVGTFYRTPAPEQPPFVDVGVVVKKGQVLCIIEAMKLMNEIEAEVAGRIAEVLVENGQVVEFGQPMFRIEPADEPTVFKKILIANRGEIALRIIRACRELGIATVAVHSTADANALHVRFADEAVCIGPPPSKESYLNIPQILSAAEITRADAIHPGYGFLSENADFAEVCENCKIHFIGPNPRVIRMMGNKVRARAAAREAGMPLLPGSPGVVKDPKQAEAIAKEIGYPIILKASAGGGGKGMKIVREPSAIAQAFSTATAEALASFANGEMYLERYVEKPRHIEIQIMADEHGNVIHLGERECSVQRRHQKLIEESPSAGVSPELREEMGRVSLEAMQKIGYTNLGTIEYLMDEKGRFYFMEMNTRVQVEHPVTEMVTGIDIVREQIKLAAGQPLKRKQKDVRFTGHAIECRINAEDPVTFVPSPGKITGYSVPGGYGVRVDSAAYENYVVRPQYDSLLAKLICYAEDRETAIRRMQRALSEYVIEGIKTNVPFHRAALAEEAFMGGNYDTRFVERLLASEHGSHRLKKAIEETP